MEPWPFLETWEAALQAVMLIIVIGSAVWLAGARYPKSTTVILAALALTAFWPSTMGEVAGHAASVFGQQAGAFAASFCEEAPQCSNGFHVVERQ